MFRLYKASGARVPDIVSDIPVGGTFAGTPADIISGKLCQITGGEIEVAVTNVAVAGIITSTYAEASVHNTYASRGATVSGQFPNRDNSEQHPCRTHQSDLKSNRSSDPPSESPRFTPRRLSVQQHRIPIHEPSTSSAPEEIPPARAGGIWDTPSSLKK